MSNQKIIFIGFLSLIVFVISLFAGNSFAQRFLTENVSVTPTIQPSSTPIAKLVDTESVCPLNGKKFTQADQMRWEQLRPVAVMIENHPESRPQSGLDAADVVYEAVAEGGITRFMALYLCEPVPQFVGPVRSARTYFLDWVLEYNSLYAHVGGANTPGPADAISQITQFGIKSINEIPLGAKLSLQAGYQRIEDRNPGVSMEHTMYLEIAKLREYAQDKFNWGVVTDNARWDSTFVKWQYANSKNEKIISEAKPASYIAYEFWEDTLGGFNVRWDYEADSNTYTRAMNDRPHIDKNTNKPITASNVIVLFQEEERANDGYLNNLHLLYQTIGKGEGYLMRDGYAAPIVWEKSGRNARTKFKDAQGQELSLSPGKIWISVVPKYNQKLVQLPGQASNKPAPSDTEE